MRRYLWALALALSVACVDCSAASLSIDGTRPGRILPNTQSTLCMWHLSKSAFRHVKRNPACDVLEFAEYVEVMGATGGSKDRDCLKNPDDRAVLDDYDFTRLVEGCRGILGLGLKPYLKLGNVPPKFSSDVSGGSFHMNVRPPDDFAVYGRYMTACAKALLEAFGRDELRTWRFAVLTEFENGGWFKDASGDPDKTFHAYCRLYETTVESFANVIAPDVTIGVHAMAVTEGLWDERRFIKYAAERKLPLKFVTASFYDRKPGQPTTGLTLPQTIEHLRDAAEAAGLTNLFYAVDEGRLLFGATRKKANDALGLRVVGDTYQAAYDARVVKQLYDSGAEYFASWGYMSGPNTFFEGLPSVSFHVARHAAKFKGMQRLPVAAEGPAPAGMEIDAVAALSRDEQSLRVMAYAFTNHLFATGTTQVDLRIRPPARWPKGGKVEAVFRLVDDNANWFDEWRKERKRLGIGDDRFHWSPDCPGVLSGPGLISAADRKTFKEQIVPRLRECAVLHEEKKQLTIGEDGTLVLSRDLPANAVLFVELANQMPHRRE